MKTSLITLALFFTIILSASSQSESFETLREKFRGQSNVYSFSTSGFLTRTIMRIAGEEEYIHILKDVKNVRLIVIPKKAFSRQHLSVEGFIKFTHREGFEELGRVRDGGDDVTVLLQTPKKNRDNRYLVIVSDDSEVVAIEMKGYINPETILNPDRKLAYANH